MIYGIGARDKCIQLSPRSNCFVSRNCWSDSLCWKVSRVIDELTWENDSWMNETWVLGKIDRGGRSRSSRERESDRHFSKRREKAVTSVTYRSIVLEPSNAEKSPEIRIVTLVRLHSTQADSCIVHSLWIQMDTIELIARALYCVLKLRLPLCESQSPLKQ